MLKLMTIASSVFLATTLAQATPVSLMGPNPQSITYFAGLGQQSVLTLDTGAGSGMTPAWLDLSLGVPLVVQTHEIGALVGQNDGSYSLLTDSHVFNGSFIVGGQSLAFSETVTLEQIANNQFQMEVAASAPASVYVPGIGTIAMSIAPAKLQLPSLSTGSGQVLSTTFVLISTVPEPAVWQLALLGGVLLTLFGMRQQRRDLNRPLPCASSS